MLRSRRKAREATLRALYQMEVGRMRVGDAIQDMIENSDLPEDLEEFARQTVQGVHDKQAWLDDKLASLIVEWDFDRIAVVDKNLLRLGAYELFFWPEIPPAVTINEAIEIAKKYSTADSGRFINGVLARVLTDSPKINWDPSEYVAFQEEAAPAEKEPEVEAIGPDTPEAKELSRIGLWRLRSEGDA
jgi:transcription antitermination factor NusB